MSMIAWNTEIVTRLKTGSIPRVMLFGDGVDRSVTPYVVVKPLSGGDRKLYQIIVHGALGTMDTLEEYLFRELPSLLKAPLQSAGKVTTVMDTGNWVGPYTDQFDNTLAMSRDFYIMLVI